MGVFQLESGGMTETCRKYGIEKIEDIIDLLALYRPGAMEYIDPMIEVKKAAKREVEYEHPLLEEICRETYGVMIYQEQVQNAAKLLAGYTLGEADLLRRAMSKKKPEEMAKQRKAFVEGCQRVNRIEPEMANRIFDKIANFAGYGFNKSHSACYGHISYWTAYLKANHPVEFHGRPPFQRDPQTPTRSASSSTSATAWGIGILPPDPQRVRPPLLPGKDRQEKGPRGHPLRPRRHQERRRRRHGPRHRGAGEEREVQERRGLRPTASTPRSSTRRSSKASSAPAPSTGRARRGPPSSPASRASSPPPAAPSATARAGQGALFDMMDLGGGGGAGESPGGGGGEAVPEWPKDERLEHEKELLGFYVTGHPLDRFRGAVDSDRYVRLGLLDDLDLSRPPRPLSLRRDDPLRGAEGNQGGQALRRPRRRGLHRFLRSPLLGGQLRPRPRRRPPRPGQGHPLPRQG